MQNKKNVFVSPSKLRVNAFMFQTPQMKFHTSDSVLFLVDMYTFAQLR